MLFCFKFCYLTLVDVKTVIPTELHLHQNSVFFAQILSIILLQVPFLLFSHQFRPWKVLSISTFNKLFKGAIFSVLIHSSHAHMLDVTIMQEIQSIHSIN